MIKVNKLKIKQKIIIIVSNILKNYIFFKNNLNFKIYCNTTFLNTKILNIILGKKKLKKNKIRFDIKNR